MFALYVLGVLCVLGVGLLTPVHPQQCEEYTNPTAPIQVFISGRRNETGHVISQVAVQRKTVWLDSNQSTDEWSLGVDHSSQVCKDGNAVTQIVLTFTAPPPPRRCLPGYKLLPEMGCYRLSNTTETWASARQICSKEGAKLIVIGSEKEAKAMKDLMYPILNGQAWMGLYEEGSDGSYFTVDGVVANANTTGYMTWFPGEPNDRTVGNCMLFSINDRVGYGYNDYVCNGKNQYICKQ